MANPANIEVKAKQVEEIREKLEKAQSVVVFDYRGLTVEEVTNLRSVSSGPTIMPSQSSPSASLSLSVIRYPSVQWSSV